MNVRRGSVVFQILCCLLTPDLSLAQADNERELDRVRAEIAEVEATLNDAINRRDDGMAELREIELALGETRSAIAVLGERIDDQLARQSDIASERESVAGRLGSEQAALAEQIRISYMTGREEVLRLLLGQDGPADLGRMLVYYDSLSRHRSEQIGIVEVELGRLIELEREGETVRIELETLRSEQERHAGELEREQGQRRELIARLDANIASAGSRIERMRAEEAALNEVIEDLAARLSEFPVQADSPITAQQGNLSWPVDGRIAGRFGDPLDEDGQVLRHGVLLQAEVGTVVRAVYHGQVRYAQWSPGMGLLLILDHGEGLWSLYGHNSALLRQNGDWVSAGDPIAEVGDTGGQGEPGLYFGIRRDLEPLDPADWVR